MIQSTPLINIGKPRVYRYAKTLYKPERPKEIHDKINKFVKENVPHFFLYAKDKENCQVANVNRSFVNQLEKRIINPRINCRKIGLGKIDYRLMVSNPNIECKVNFLKNGKIDEKNTNPLIVKYLEISRSCYYKINYNVINNLHGELLTKSQLRQDLAFKQIVANTKKALSQFGYNEFEIVDILVKFLYDIKSNKYKILLWNCYGDIIYQNLSNHMKLKIKSIQCVDCGEWFNMSINNKKTCRCENCKKEYDKILKKERNRRYYLHKTN